MGVDLRLLPLMLPAPHSEMLLSHEIWAVERRSEMWDEIFALPQKQLKKPLSCFLSRLNNNGDTGYGNVFESPYGEPLTYTTAADLLTLKYHDGVQDNWRNRAIWAALAEMPSDWPVVLYWH